METVEALQWLKQAKIYDLAKEYSPALKKIFTPCLGVKHEKLLIIGDVGYEGHYVSPILACAYYLAAEELKLNTKLVLQDVKTRGQVADYDVINSMSNLEEKSIVIVNLSDKLGSLATLGKSFRKICYKKQHKFCSALSLGDITTDQVRDVVNAIDINYKPMQLQQNKVKEILDNANQLHISTKAGTDLYYNIKGIKAKSADGNYTEAGTGGNMPAGEVYIPPNGKRVEGTVVLDGSSRNRKHTDIIKKPIKLEIKEGTITGIEGGKEADDLKETLEWAKQKSKHPGSIYRIGELGIGFNPKAKIIGSTLVDEKTKGTAHIGIGSNYWFGGSIYAIVHLDQIFKNPEIKVDNKKLEF